jgi:predicted nucleic-acid-binding Zn-ribbon protein
MRISAKHFVALSCENCGYTELFNLTVLEGRTDLENFLRGLFGG